VILHLSNNLHIYWSFHNLYSISYRYAISNAVYYNNKKYIFKKMQFSKTELIYQYHPNKHLSTNLSIKNTSNHNQLFKVHSGKDKSLKHQNQIVSLLNRTWDLFNLIKKSMFKFVFIKMYA
jgi:hypothetical protein